MGEYVVADLPYDNGPSARPGADRGAVVVPSRRSPVQSRALRLMKENALQSLRTFVSPILLKKEGGVGLHEGDIIAPCRWKREESPRASRDSFGTSHIDIGQHLALRVAVQKPGDVINHPARWSDRE